MERHAELHIMTKAAEKAAIGLIRDFGELERLQVSRKGFGNFVTCSDKRAEEKIVYELSRSRPEFSFLCEETGFIEKENKSQVWVVDPIDGTLNFMRGIPYFSINIALIQDNKPVAGITLNPLRNELFKASVGEGAFLGNRNRIRVSRREDLKEAIVATRIDPKKDVELANKGCLLRRNGSTSLDLAHVAAGNYDIAIIHNVNFWDIASGIILVKEAGGFIDIEKTEQNKYNIIAASSSKILKTVKNIVK